MSGLFASELDHYSRSYVEHAQNQIQENAREAAEHARELMAEARRKATANFAERAEQMGREQSRSVRLENRHRVRTERGSHGSAYRAGPLQTRKRYARALPRNISAPFRSNRSKA